MISAFSIRLIVDAGGAMNNARDSEKPILWFKYLSIADVPLVGGKNASLGEMCESFVPEALEFQMALLSRRQPIGIF